MISLKVDYCVFCFICSFHRNMIFKVIQDLKRNMIIILIYVLVSSPTAKIIKYKIYIYADHLKIVNIKIVYTRMIIISYFSIYVHILFCLYCVYNIQTSNLMLHIFKIHLNV